MKSKCCGAEIECVTKDQYILYLICSQCKQPCDVRGEDETAL